MDAAPQTFDLEEWMPVIRKLVVLVIALAGSYGATSIADSTSGELKATEAAATEGIRTDQIVDDTYNLLQVYVVRAASCDTALEMYGGPEDFDKVMKKCHSDEAIE